MGRARRRAGGRRPRGRPRRVEPPRPQAARRRGLAWSVLAIPNALLALVAPVAVIAAGCSPAAPASRSVRPSGTRRSSGTSRPRRSRGSRRTTGSARSSSTRSARARRPARGRDRHFRGARAPGGLVRALVRVLLALPPIRAVRNDPASLRAMRVLVTGGAGFIGSHFVRRLAAAGDEVVVLDKLTYSGNPANLEGVEHEFHRGDIADPDAVAEAAAGCDAIVNFAAETHVDRSILGAGEFVRTEFFGTQVLLEHVRVRGVPLRPGLDRRGLRRPRARRLARRRPRRCGRRARTASKAARRPAGPRVRAHVRRQRVDHARLEHLRPEPVPGEAHPALRHERDRGQAAAALRRRPAAPRLAPRRGPLRRRSSSCCARARRARPTTSAAARSARTSRSRTRSSTLLGADPSLLRHVADRPGHDRRYALDTSKLRGARLDAHASVRGGASRTTVDWYRDNRDWWEPIKSGEFRAYYERQYAPLAG